MKNRGLPGVQDDVMPPEFEVRPTEVIEMGDPAINVVEPNAIGSLGNSPIPSEDLWRFGLDPYRNLGADPMGTAMRASQTLVNKLRYNHRVQQVSAAQVLEHEGGSEVTYHEPNLDDQEINVAGVEISNGVEQLEHLAANLHTQHHQQSPVTLRESRTMVHQFAQSMSGPSRQSLTEVLQRLGREGLDSLSHEPLPGTIDRVSVANDSGLVLSSDMAETPLHHLMQFKAAQQAANAVRPMARFHPGQSGYASPDGQFGATTPMRKMLRRFKNGRLRKGMPMRGLGATPAEPGTWEPGMDVYQSYFDVRRTGKSTTPGLPGAVTYPEGGPATIPGGTGPILPGGGGAPGSGEDAYDVFMVGSGAPALPPGMTGKGDQEITPDQNVWYEIPWEAFMAAQAKGKHSLSDLSSRAQRLNPVGKSFTLLTRGTVVKRWFLVGASFSTDPNVRPPVYVYVSQNKLPGVLKKLGVVDEPDVVLVPEGEQLDPNKKYWIEIGQKKYQASIGTIARFKDLPTRAQKLLPVYGSTHNYTVVRGTVVKRWFAAVMPKADSKIQCYVYASPTDLPRIKSKLTEHLPYIVEPVSPPIAPLPIKPVIEPDLQDGPPPPGTGSEDTISTVAPDGTTVYEEDLPYYQEDLPYYQAEGEKETNWLAIGGMALGAAALIGAVVIATRK